MPYICSARQRRSSLSPMTAFATLALFAALPAASSAAGSDSPASVAGAGLTTLATAAAVAIPAPAARPAPALAAAGGGQVPGVGAITPFPLYLRLGAMVSPRLKFAGGADVTIPGLHLLPGFTSRVTGEAIVSANFHGISTLVPLTFDQVYSRGLLLGQKIYAGAGIGAYIGNVTRFGGKLFVGAMVTSRLGGEASIHWSGSGVPLVVVQARLGL